MGYMILGDYKSFIQEQYFQQLIQGDDSKRLTEEQTAIRWIISRLKQKYDVNYEFTETSVWDYNRAYGATDRVYLDADLYNSANIYVVNDLTLYQGNVYLCGNDTTGTFTPADWKLLGAQYDLFFASYPSTCTLNGKPNPATLANPNAPVFNYLNLYKKGDVVFWKGNTYVCNQDTLQITHEQLINYFYYSNVPYLNVFPDDVMNNQNNKFWSNPTVYVVTAGTLPTDDTAWTKGDNRNPIVLRCMKSLVIWALSPNISTMNIPKKWESEYNYALETLKSAANGEITLDLLLIQPKSGQRIRFGGNIKLKMGY